MKSYFSRSRRSFLKNTSLFSAGVLATPFLPSLNFAHVLAGEQLKITKIEAIRFKDATWTWIKIYTDKGITGLGETYPLTNSQIGALKDLSRLIIGKNALDIEKLWYSLYRAAAYNITGGAEMRIISAINIAQWDIMGKYLKTPVYQLLGGKVNDQIKVYNTTFGINDWRNEKDIEKIVKFLMERGITAMKIWPFDPTAQKNNGSYISPTEIEKNLDWVKRIRNTAGLEMEIGMEFHSHWNYTSAQRITKALEPYKVMWVEDIMMPEHLDNYARLAAETDISVCISERLATSYQFKNLLQAKACDIAMYDVTWCGGISAAKEISDLADSYAIPCAPHTYGGPILYYASMHVAATLSNLFIMETGHNYYDGRYPEFLTSVIVPKNGFVAPPDLPGLGLEVNDKIYTSGKAAIEVIS